MVEEIYANEGDSCALCGFVMQKRDDAWELDGDVYCSRSCCSACDGDCGDGSAVTTNGRCSECGRRWGGVQ